MSLSCCLSTVSLSEIYSHIYAQAQCFANPDVVPDSIFCLCGCQLDNKCYHQKHLHRLIEFFLKYPLQVWGTFGIITMSGGEKCLRVQADRVAERNKQTEESRGEE